MSAPKKSNKPAKPDNAAADLGATGFAVDQIRQALACAPDEDVLDKARATVEHLALVKTALDKSERLRDEAFRRLVDVFKNHGLPVGDAIDPDKFADLTEHALAGLNQRLDQACEILGIPEDKRNVDAMLATLRESYKGLNRQLDALRREVLDTKRILGIDDPDGMLLDEQGHVMGDIMDAWAETKRVLLVNQYPIPDSLPEACLALTALVEELDGRIDSALGNLARHTSATAIEDATMEVRDKLDDAETRLKHLENNRLQALADFDPTEPQVFTGTMKITSIDREEECSRIVRDLMRKIVDGKISLLHNV